MECLDDTAMAPQEEESIDDVKWMRTDEVRQALYNSYRTIRYVIQEYNKQLKSKVADQRSYGRNSFTSPSYRCTSLMMVELTEAYFW